MAQKVLVMQVRAADKSMQDKYCEVLRGCIVDRKEQIALQARDPATAESIKKPRIMPWPVVKSFVGWWYGDSEPMAFHRRGNDYRSETATVTRTESLRLNNECTDAALMEAAGGLKSNTIWRPFIRAVSGVVIITGVLFLVAYLNGGVAGFGG